MFYITLTDADGKIVQRITAKEAGEAKKLLRPLLNSQEWLGQSMTLMLKFHRRVMLIHEFDKKTGHANHWVDRYYDIDWPTGQKGRPSLLVNAQRYQVFLDDVTHEKARKMGNGNVSEGLRKVFLQLEKLKTAQESSGW